MTTNIDVFDVPVREALESYVRGIGHKPSELTTVLEESIKAAKEELGDSWKTQNNSLLKRRIQDHAKVYIDAVLGQSQIWRECRERIKAHNSILLAGAGLSYESNLPLAKLLDDFLKFSGISNDDWQLLRTDPSKCLAFKRLFAAKCADKVPSKSHQIIVRNFPNHVLEIISLNWDDLFEKAAQAEGKNVNKQNEDKTVTATRCLWKFHGDVSNITPTNIPGHGGWIFPGEQGYVFASFKDYVTRIGLNSDLFTFLILGYSEGEKVISDEIITVLESNPPRPTYRIGPSLALLYQPFHIVGTADFTLSKILPA